MWIRLEAVRFLIRGRVGNLSMITTNLLLSSVEHTDINVGYVYDLEIVFLLSYLEVAAALVSFLEKYKSC